MTVTMRPAARCGQPVAAAPATTALPAAARPAGPATASWPTLGTTAALAVTDPALLPAARDLLAAEIAAVDAACSSFRDDSEITAVNAAARQHGGPVRVSPLLAEAIGAALRAARQTGGDVDPLAGPGYRVTAAIRAAAQAGRDAGAPAGPRTRAAAPGEPAEPRPAGAPAAAPLAVVTSAGWRHVRLDAARGLVSLPPGSRLDLGGTAKAVAADHAAASIAARLGCGVLVCIGGDVAAGGEAPPGGWRVRVQAAGTVTAAADVPTAVVSIRGGGLATAGPGAARWHRGGDVLAHLLSPRGRALAASRWRLASVTAATCVEARAASIAAIISGDGAAGWLAARGLPARLVDAAGRATTVAGWPAEPGRPGWSGLITTGGGGHRAGGHRAGDTAIRERAANNGSTAMSGITASTALWYASRATGIVCLVLLTAVMVLGIMVNRQGRLPGLPRFAVTGLHRNLSLLAVGFLAVHVLTAIADPFVTIGLAAVVVPLASPYRPLWIGLGAVSLDLMLALILTSLVRARIGRRLWRGLHWLAYAAWPVALAHSIGSSGDLQAGPMLALAAACTAAVAGAAGWRAARAARATPRARRAAAVLSGQAGAR